MHYLQGVRKQWAGRHSFPLRCRSSVRTSDQGPPREFAPFKIRVPRALHSYAAASQKGVQNSAKKCLILHSFSDGCIFNPPNKFGSLPPVCLRLPPGRQPSGRGCPAPSLIHSAHAPERRFVHKLRDSAWCSEFGRTACILHGVCSLRSPTPFLRVGLLLRFRQNLHKEGRSVLWSGLFRVLRE